METAGAEALSVFPSENPPRHIRISTAKKVCCDFILLNARWVPVHHCLPGLLGRTMAPWSTRVPCGELEMPVLKQVGLGKAYGKKASPEKELNMIFCNSIYMIRMMVLVQMGNEGRLVGFNKCLQNTWWFSHNRGP